MTTAELRAHLDAMFGPVRTVDRAAQAMGCSRRAMFEYLAGDKPIPRWLPIMLELMEQHGCSGEPLH